MKDVEFGGRDVKWPAVPWLEKWVEAMNSPTVSNWKQGDFMFFHSKICS